MMWKSWVSLALVAAAAQAKIVCKSSNSDQDSTTLTSGPYIGLNPNGNQSFITVGDDSSSDWGFVYAFDCTSNYMNIKDANQTALPQVSYGLMVLLGDGDGPDTTPGPDKQCLAVKFKEGSTTEGTLVSQACSFRDDESQVSQFWSFWGTYPPYRFFHKFVGHTPNGKLFNPYPYGPGYNFKYASENGATVFLKYEKQFKNGVALEEVG